MLNRAFLPFVLEEGEQHTHVSDEDRDVLYLL